MSVAQAERFYGPLKTIFRDKLRSDVARRIREALESVFDFEISADDMAQLDSLNRNERTGPDPDNFNF